MCTGDGRARKRANRRPGPDQLEEIEVNAVGAGVEGSLGLLEGAAKDEETPGRRGTIGRARGREQVGVS